MEMLVEWPDWWVWCAAVVGGGLAGAVVVSVIEATLDLDGR